MPLFRHRRSNLPSLRPERSDSSLEAKPYVKDIVLARMLIRDGDKVTEGVLNMAEDYIRLQKHKHLSPESEAIFNKIQELKNIGKGHLVRPLLGELRTSIQKDWKTAIEQGVKRLMEKES